MSMAQTFGMLMLYVYVYCECVCVICDALCVLSSAALHVRIVSVRWLDECRQETLQWRRVLSQPAQMDRSPSNDTSEGCSSAAANILPAHSELSGFPSVSAAQSLALVMCVPPAPHEAEADLW